MKINKKKKTIMMVKRTELRTKTEITKNKQKETRC